MMFAQSLLLLVRILKEVSWRGIIGYSMDPKACKSRSVALTQRAGGLCSWLLVGCCSGPLFELLRWPLTKSRHWPSAPAGARALCPRYTAFRATKGKGRRGSSSGASLMTWRNFPTLLPWCLRSLREPRPAALREGPASPSSPRMER